MDTGMAADMHAVLSNGSIAKVGEGDIMNQQHHSLRSTSSFCDEVLLEELLAEVEGNSTVAHQEVYNRDAKISAGVACSTFSTGMLDAIVDLDKGFFNFCCKHDYFLCRN